MNEPSQIKGWCPGALRPMESGDGLIVRLRLSGHEASTHLAAEIADWAEAYGNGLIDLSARANLQLRGVTPVTLPSLTQALEERGLLDASPEAEAVRNVIVSPFAGIEALAPLDVRPYAQALERELSENRRLWRLPGKFGFAIDAGDFPLGETLADVTFEAISANAFVVRLAGAADHPLGPIAAASLAPAARSLAEAFLSLRNDPAFRRMRDAVAAVGVDLIAEAAGLRMASNAPPRQAPRSQEMLGVHEAKGHVFVGVALPFGRISAGDLRRLAKRAGAASLRLSPWRTIIVHGLARDAAEHFVAMLADLDLILDAADPRLHVAACPGAPSCQHAAIDARRDAAALAPLIAGVNGPDPILHVSGCAKGCAHPTAARFTIVGDGGAYNLIRNGPASAPPILSGLSRGGLTAALAQAIGASAE